MSRRAAVMLCGLVAAVGVATAEDRLAVLEFFGRPSGAYCAAAGPAMTTLQQEMAGRALLLEYHVDLFRYGRFQRFATADPQANVLPMVMVGSGYRTCWGSLDYEPQYRTMLLDELARPPQAEVEAWWWRDVFTARVDVRVVNRSAAPIGPGDEATVWAIVWEESTEGVGRTWVRGLASATLAAPLAPGGDAEVSLSVSAQMVDDWNRVHVAVVVDHYLAGTHRYDTLQAAEAGPPAFQAAPAAIGLTSLAPAAALEVGAPPSASWSVAAVPAWLRVAPESGAGTKVLRVSVAQGHGGARALDGSFRLEVTGAGLDESREIPVTYRGGVRRATGRVR